MGRDHLADGDDALMRDGTTNCGSSIQGGEPLSPPCARSNATQFGASGLVHAISREPCGGIPSVAKWVHLTGGRRPKHDPAPIKEWIDMRMTGRERPVSGTEGMDRERHRPTVEIE